ncbi:uncharacterized protein LOC129611368 [Condylostylus longicornis]|uniref:uncharacterized protein LOC129611368 n=1 Tax=Condylostylus longicornis TaxID=2530218 RepID=UPI00244DA746|nr:uncharacterized protein LOC129611368 [Condylostylus longicornis]
MMILIKKIYFIFRDETDPADELSVEPRECNTTPIYDFDSENSKNYNFLNVSESKKIEKDIKQMKLALKQSQEFFSSARDSLELINLENIKHRIKDLHLYPNTRELNDVLRDLERNKKHDVEILTKVIGEKFKDHPGEFADIPEVSSFFKLCTQLQRGLDDLDKKKENLDSLEKRILWATNVSENRSKDIQNLLPKLKKN